MSELERTWEDEAWELERERARRRVYSARPEAEPQPIGASLGELIGNLEALVARMKATACEGDRQRVLACTAEVERACPERTCKACPKRVMEFDRRVGVEQADLVRVYQGMYIPLKMASVLASSAFYETRATRMIDTWIRDPGRAQVLVLFGRVEVGKSLAAAYALTRLPGIYVSVPYDFVAGQRDHAFLRRLRIPGVVVFDDLGLEMVDDRDSFAAAFSAAFKQRLDAGAMSIITSNLSPQQIRQRYGDRMADWLDPSRGRCRIEVVGALK